MTKKLLWIGLGMLSVGAVIALVAKKSAEDAALRVQFEGAAMGYQWGYEPNFTGMWFGIIIAALGAVALLMYVARPSNERTERG